MGKLRYLIICVQLYLLQETHGQVVHHRIQYANMANLRPNRILLANTADNTKTLGSNGFSSITLTNDRSKVATSNVGQPALANLPVAVSGAVARNGQAGAVRIVKPSGSSFNDNGVAVSIVSTSAVPSAINMAKSSTGVNRVNNVVSTNVNNAGVDNRMVGLIRTYTISKD